MAAGTLSGRTMLPFLVFGSATLLAGMAAAMLPETLGTSLLIFRHSSLVSSLFQLLQGDGQCQRNPSLCDSPCKAFINRACVSFFLNAAGAATLETISLVPAKPSASEIRMVWSLCFLFVVNRKLQACCVVLLCTANPPCPRGCDGHEAQTPADTPVVLSCRTCSSRRTDSAGRPCGSSGAALAAPAGCACPGQKMSTIRAAIPAVA